MLKGVVPDLGYYMDEFFFRLRRRRGESMAEYAMRSRDKYQRLRQALARVTVDEKRRKGPKKKKTKAPQHEDLD